MKLAITSVAISTATRKRVSKAQVTVVDTDQWFEMGILKTRNPSFKQVEEEFEKSRTGREVTTKVVDIRVA